MFNVARQLGCFVTDIEHGMSAKEFAEWGIVLNAKRPEDLETMEMTMARVDRELRAKIGVAD